MKKPTMVIVNSNYPNENNRYGDVFVHSRLKHYANHFDVHVVGWKKKVTDYSFVYEGIPVDVVNTSDKLVSKLKSYEPRAIGFHFIEGWMYTEIVRTFRGPIFIWIHGGEALGWYRRLFQLGPQTLYPFARYVARNTIQMIQMHNLITYANKSNQVTLIFVSRWMKSITEKDTLTSIKNPEYIPNPIDSTVFDFQQKQPEDRKKILLIRSFDSKKYANDIAVEAILLLSKKPFFRDLTFAIYGVGRYYQPLTDKLKSFRNVFLNNFFIENKNIPAIHKQHGIFLCPTRQDAQGVSMCEAMSSGLVPISSYNTAIPEFIEHGKSGYLTTSAQEIAKTIEHLYNNPDEFIQVSRNAGTHIRSKSSTELVVSKEVKMILNALQHKN